MSISDKPSLHNAPPTSASDEEKSHDISEEVKATTATTATPPPDGGRKAWLTVLGAFCAAFASVGWASSIGIFQAQYETDQLRHYSTSTVSWITSMQVFFMHFVCLGSGALFDRFGPRVPLFIGSFMHLFGLIMLSLSHKYYQILLSQSVCSGIGLSLIMMPAIASPQTYFAKKRAIAMGLVISGSSIGGIVWPLMARSLLPQIGFGWTIRCCALLALVLLAIANLFVTSNLVHKKKEIKLEVFLKPVKERNFQLLCIGTFFVYWGMYVPINYIATSAIEYGLSSSMAFSLVPILNAASFFGRIVPNVIADKAGRFNVYIMMNLLSVAVCFGLWLPASVATTIAFAVLFGFSSGAGMGLGSVVVASISPMEEIGFRMGIILAIAALASLTGLPAAGAIVSADGGRYFWVCVFAALSWLAAATFLTSVRVRLAGWKLTVRV